MAQPLGKIWWVLQKLNIGSPYTHAQSLSHVQLFETPYIVAPQVPLFMEFSRQEDWSGLPFPTPGDLPDQGIESTSLVSPALADGFFTTEPDNLHF